MLCEVVAYRQSSLIQYANQSIERYYTLYILSYILTLLEKQFESKELILVSYRRYRKISIEASRRRYRKIFITPTISKDKSCSLDRRVVLKETTLSANSKPTIIIFKTTTIDLFIEHLSINKPTIIATKFYIKQIITSYTVVYYNRYSILLAMS